MIATAWSCTGTLVTTVLNENCTVTATSTDSTSTPVYTQDSGDLTFELAFIIFLISFIFMGMFFNLFFSKRLSRQHD